MTAEIVEFLLARFAEDEAVARALENCHDPLDWSEPGDPAVGLAGPVDGPSGYQSIVIDPARVLAECAAKRRIVEQWSNDARYPDDISGYETAIDGVLRDLASVYAHHADYQEEWRPQE